MTKKEYALIATVIRNLTDIAPSTRAQIATDFARALSESSGYTLNGNRRLDRESFLVACGVLTERGVS